MIVYCHCTLLLLSTINLVLRQIFLVNTSLMVQTLMPFLVVISYWLIVHISFQEILEINFHLVL